MLTKIILFLLIPTVWYVMTVFTAPEIASKIDSLIWIPWFSDNLRGTKSNFDAAVTDIPSLQEFKSGALDIKETVIDSVSTTKDTIDTVRWWAQKIEETYNDAKDVVEDINGKVTNIKNTLDDVQSLGNNISNVVNTDFVESIDNNN